MNQDKNTANEIRPGLQLPLFTGKTLFSRRAHNLIVRCVTSLLNLKVHVIDSANQLVQEAKVHVSDAGVDIYLNSASTSGGGGSGNVRQMIVNGIPTGTGGFFANHHPDYLICNDYSGGVSGNTTYKVAKPPFLRYSIFDTNIDNNPVSFYYDTPDATNGTVVGQRSAVFNSPQYSSQQEIISRPYFTGNIIYAMQVDGGVIVQDGVGSAPSIVVDWIDLNVEARQWMFQYGQI